MDEKVFSKDQYFEAKIQLRPPLPEIINFIINQVRKRGDTFISKMENVRGGVDIYLSSQKYAKTIGQKLKRAFPKGELKESRTIHTRNKLKSRDVYRRTILFRMPIQTDEN